MIDRPDPFDCGDPLSLSTGFGDCGDPSALSDSLHILCDTLVPAEGLADHILDDSNFSAEGCFGHDDSMALSRLFLDEPGLQAFDPPAGAKAAAAARDEGAKNKQASLRAIAKSRYNCVRANGNKKKPDAAPSSAAKRLSKPRRRRSVVRAKDTVDFEPSPYNFEKFQRPVKNKKKERRATIDPSSPAAMGQPFGYDARSVNNAPRRVSPVVVADDSVLREGMRKLRESMLRSELSRRQVAMQRAIMAAPQQRQQMVASAEARRASFYF